MQGNHSFRSCRSTADTDSAEAGPSSHSNSMHGGKPSDGLHIELACVPVHLLSSLSKQAVVSITLSIDGMMLTTACCITKCGKCAKRILLSDVPPQSSVLPQRHACYTDGAAMSCRLACKGTSTRAASRSNSLVWNSDLGTWSLFSSADVCC